MKLELPEETIADLESLESQYSIVAMVPNRIIAWISDKYTGRVYAKADGPTEADAVITAIKAAKGIGKPKRPHEMLQEQAAENASLKEEVAKLKEKLGEAPSTPTKKPARGGKGGVDDDSEIQ